MAILVENFEVYIYQRNSKFVGVAPTFEAVIYADGLRIKKIEYSGTTYDRDRAKADTLKKARGTGIFGDGTLEGVEFETYKQDKTKLIDRQKFTISGRVVKGGNNKPLKDVKVKYEGTNVYTNTYTDKKGVFNLLVVIPIDGNGDVVEEERSKQIVFTKKKFNTTKVSPLTGTNQVKTKLNLTRLTPVSKQIDKDVSEASTVDDQTVKAVSSANDKATPTPQKAINKAVKTVSERLIPYIIGILAAFGISQIKNWLEGTNNLDNTPTIYPTKASLQRQIAKRNKVVRQLNNLYKIVNAAIIAVGVATTLLKIFQKLLNLFGRFPVPSTIGTFPGPSGGVIRSFKIGNIIRLDAKYDKYKGKFKLFKEIPKIILTALILLRFYLKSALDLLKIADNKMDQCANELGVDFTQEEIDNELLAIGAQEQEQGNPVLTNVNGFTMGVQAIPQTQVNTLIKRQAIAKDSKGVIVLKGEPSFASSDQILIDELAFYITSNNLKA